MKNLVRDWKKNHPTVDIINDVVNKLRKEKESLENLSLPRQPTKEESCNSLSSLSDDNLPHPPVARIISIYPKLPESLEETTNVNILKYVEPI